MSRVAPDDDAPPFADNRFGSIRHHRRRALGHRSTIREGEMSSMLHGRLAAWAAVALSAAAPASAQILKCQAAGGAISYTQGACPPGARAVPMGKQALDANALESLPPARAGRAAPPGGGLPDAPLAAIDTGVPVITQMVGRYAWLDADTLAITTFSEPRGATPWMVRRVVAFDAGSHAVKTLLPKGFLECADPMHALVSVEIGDLESRFGGGSKAAPATQQFEVWMSDSRALAAAPAGVSAGWHPHSCAKVAPEDMALSDLFWSKKPMRYLEPEHGELAWGFGADGHPQAPSLRTAKKKTMLPLGINDISHEVRYLPWAKAYQVSAGIYSHAIDPARDDPLITMDLEGRVSKRAWPSALAGALDAANAGAAGSATMLAVRGGALVVQPGPARRGGGFYLVRNEQVKRVWCTASPMPGQSAADDACATSQPVQVSPDGCRVAFDAKPAQGGSDPTVRVMDVCTAAETRAAQLGTAKSVR
jgi:hypothetical protein